MATTARATPSSGDNVCGNNKQDVSTNVLIEGAYFHDLEYDPSAPDAHWECMYLNGGKNVTIRGNRFERCAIFDLFVTISGPDARAIGHENLTIENNYFAPATNGLGIAVPRLVEPLAVVVPELVPARLPQRADSGQQLRRR